MRTRGAVIHPDKRMVSLRVPSREMIEFELPLPQAQDSVSTQEDAYKEEPAVAKTATSKFDSNP